MLHSNALAETADPTPAPAPAGTRGVFARALSAMLKAARNMFGLDYRSLALLRVGLGLCLLWDVYANACEMRAFYTDEGVLPRGVLLGNTNDFHAFSLYFASGGMPYIATLVALQIVLALMMLVGYRTRLVTVASYLLLLSMQNRQPVLLFGADVALRVGLFWSLFLPLSKRFSVDRLVGRTRPAPNRPYLGIAGIAFIVQVCIIYTGGALMKSGRTWQVDHTAVAYALAMDVYSRPLGQWLSHFQKLTRALTVITLNLELYGPALFILPLASQWGRLVGFILFAGLQIGFGLCMMMGLFGPVMITLTLVFLPPFFWERIAEPCGRRLASLFHGVATAGSTWVASARLGASSRSWIKRERLRNALSITHAQSREIRAFGFVLALVRDGLLVLLVVVVVLWNVGNIPGQRWRLAPTLESLGNRIGLDQIWNMFAPNPATTDGWFVVAGKLRNGQTVDLISGANPVSFDKPASIAGSYPSEIWREYLTSFWDEGASSPELFAKYMGKIWNKHHPGEEQLESIEIYSMSETIEPGPSKSPVTPERIWVEQF